MDEIILEKLKDEFEYLTIEVEYYEIKTYKIYISCNLKEFDNTDTIKGVEFLYKWQDHLTTTANIDLLKHKIELAILEFFRKEN